jgi:O-antigen/teichoic acid export membrane protein
MTVAIAATRVSWLARLTQLPLTDLLSFRYTLLRAWTAGGAMIAGLVQTFVFARVLDPEQFSLFILVGALGVSMWLFDLGLSKILFVRMRRRYLAGEDTLSVAAQANAVATFYAVLIAGGALICFAVMAQRPSTSSWQAAEFALFFFFSAFNLSWFVLRNVSVAIDDYIYFETLESCRRIGYIALMLAMLAGLPFPAFVIAINLGWALLMLLAGVRLVRRGALAPRLQGLFGHLRMFLHDNGQAAVRTGTHAAGEIYVHNVLYLVAPYALGLGAPTIVLDTVLKIFLGTVNVCSAACDVLVPRQTAAYAAGDRRTLIRATAIAVAFCALCGVGIAALLAFDAKDVFALLLGPAAVMPPSVMPILFVLLAAGAIKTAPNFLLQYTGYFRTIAWLSIVNVVVMTAAVAIGLALHLDVIGLLTVYAGVFVMAAALYIGFALRGPIRDGGTEQ